MGLGGKLFNLQMSPGSPGEDQGRGPGEGSAVVGISSD